MPLRSIYHATDKGLASELQIMPTRPTRKKHTVGFCASWPKTKIMSNLAFVVEGILLKEIKLKEKKIKRAFCSNKKGILLKERKKKTLQYPMFWTAEHAYVAEHKFEGHPEAVRILGAGGPLSSFANMRENNIETLDLKVE